MSLLYFNLDKKRFQKIVNTNLHNIDILELNNNYLSKFLCENIISDEKTDYWFDLNEKKFFIKGDEDENAKTFVDFYYKILIKQIKFIIDNSSQKSNNTLHLRKFIQMKKIKNTSFIENFTNHLIVNYKFNKKKDEYNEKLSKLLLNELQDGFKQLCKSLKNTKTKIKEKKNEKKIKKLELKKNSNKKLVNIFIKDIESNIQKLSYDDFQWYDNYYQKCLNNELFNYKKN
jgi:hypothetical protein